MAGSTDYAAGKSFPVKKRKRCVEMFKKEHHEKWPFITIDKKGDTYIYFEVWSIVVK